MLFAIICLLMWTNPPIEKHRMGVKDKKGMETMFRSVVILLGMWGLVWGTQAEARMPGMGVGIVSGQNVCPSCQKTLDKAEIALVHALPQPFQHGLWTSPEEAWICPGTLQVGASMQKVPSVVGKYFIDEWKKWKAAKQKHPDKPYLPSFPFILAVGVLLFVLVYNLVKRVKKP